MTTIRDKLADYYSGAKYKKVTGDYGLELETEVRAPADYPPDFFELSISDMTDPDSNGMNKVKGLTDWVTHKDGSLRNFGVEFVLAKPLPYLDAVDAIRRLLKRVEGVNFIKDSISTSTHIHWNAFNSDFLTLANFLTLYTMYENVLLELCGPMRKSNLFALPMRCCERSVRDIVKLLKDFGNNSTDVLYDFSENTSKYAALNLSALNKFGSLEIRSYKGSTNEEELLTWLGIINSMVLYAKTGITPDRILNDYKNSPGELHAATFGRYEKILRDAAGVHFDELIIKNLWFVKQIVDVRDDWSTFNDIFPAPEKKPAVKKTIETVTIASDTHPGYVMPSAAQMAANAALTTETISNLYNTYASELIETPWNPETWDTDDLT